MGESERTMELGVQERGPLLRGHLVGEKWPGALECQLVRVFPGGSVHGVDQGSTPLQRLRRLAAPQVILDDHPQQYRRGAMGTEPGPGRLRCLLGVEGSEQGDPSSLVLL